MTKRGRGGRPSKGERDLFVSRPHVDIGQIIRARAERSGYTLSDYVSMILAEHVGRSDLAPAPSNEPQKPQEEELPLTG